MSGESLRTIRSLLAKVDLDDAEHLYAAGYEFIDLGAPEVAVNFLRTALRRVTRRPHSAKESARIASELSSAYEEMGAYRDALTMLHELPAVREADYSCRYLYAFLAIMCEDLPLAHAARERLEATSDSNHETLRATIDAMLERAQRSRVAGARVSSRSGMRTWRYVQTGSMVVGSGLGQLAQVELATCIDALRALDPIPAVYRIDGDPLADVLAPIVAGRLGAALGGGWRGSIPSGPGVLVVSDLECLTSDQLDQLVNRSPDQILYVHTCVPSKDYPIAPDVVGVMANRTVLPVATDDVDLTIRRVVAVPLTEPNDEWIRFVSTAWPPSEEKRGRWFRCADAPPPGAS